jgi:MFS superfamily sulfate permease-like transporter
MMSDQINLRDVLKRTIQLINYEDGLWDLLLGAVFLMLSIYPVTREKLGPEWNLGLFLAVLFILVVGQLVARHFISTPRMGYAKSRRTPALKGVLIINFVLVLATFALVILTLVNPGWIPEFQFGSFPQWVNDMSVDIVVMLALIGLFSLLGYLFGVKRLYLYGWLIGGGNLASTAMYLYGGAVFNLPLAIVSGIIIAIGAYLLQRFLHTYPIPVEES